MPCETLRSSKGRSERRRRWAFFCDALLVGGAADTGALMLILPGYQGYRLLPGPLCRSKREFCSRLWNRRRAGFWIWRTRAKRTMCQDIKGADRAALLGGMTSLALTGFGGQRRTHRRAIPRQHHPNRGPLRWRQRVAGCREVWSGRLRRRIAERILDSYQASFGRRLIWR